MKISKYVSLAEVVKSNTAIRKSIDNTPTQEQLNRIESSQDPMLEMLKSR